MGNRTNFALLKIVNNILLIYFCIGACFPKCDFSQIGHIDDLWSHYQLHRSESLMCGNELSFLDFLYQHFVEGDQDHHQEDDNQDQLPFQSIASGMTLFLNASDLIIPSLPIPQHRNPIAFESNLISDPFLNPILQPPSFLS